MHVYELKTKHLISPIGIDAVDLRMGWKIKGIEKNIVQNAYQIQAYSNQNGQDLIWDSNRIESNRSQNVLWEGVSPKSRQRVFWKVTVWLSSDAFLEEKRIVSELTFFETGLNECDWKAEWVVPEREVDENLFKPSPCLRKSFAVKKNIVRARAYFTAHGVYQFFLNGKIGTEDLFAPGYTSYYHRLQYQTYDITDLLTEGENVLAIMLGDGWWRGGVGAFHFRNNFGNRLGFLGQIELEYEDGTIEIIITDETFRTKDGPIRMSDFKAGELYDESYEMPGWMQDGFDDSDWKNVTAEKADYTILKAKSSVPIRKKEVLFPELLQTANGEMVLDFKQNFSGRIAMDIELKKGQKLEFFHGEILDADGNFTIDNLVLSPKEKEEFQRLTFIAGSDGRKTYEPYFTTFGFRYVLVKGIEIVNASDFCAYAIYSDMDITGGFHCSNERINKLVSNTIWSQKSNFMDVPTDCPTRERASWTGDAQLYCSTASKFMDTYSFYEKWLRDLDVEQYESGAVPITVPGVDLHSTDEYNRRNEAGEKMIFPLVKPGEPGFADGSSGWGDAAVIVPWKVYLATGDTTILRNQYDSAKAWVNYIIKSAGERNTLGEHYEYYKNEKDWKYIWDTKFHFGEWLEADQVFDPQNEDPQESYLDRTLVATAYYAYSARLLSKMAFVLKKEQDHKYYKDIAEKVSESYGKYFIQTDGSINKDRQAPNVRTLAFDLCDEKDRAAVANKLAELVIQKGLHLNTGFLSTPYLLQALSQNGFCDIAYALLQQSSSPSWLYAVDKGATTIWENWNAVAENGKIEGSLNHYAYGAVCDFLFEETAGIKVLENEPGYKYFTIQPVLGVGISEASAFIETTYGRIRSEWKMDEDFVTYEFEIPANTKAEILFEGTLLKTQELFDASISQTTNGMITGNFGSGCYTITAKRSKKERQ
ncbi:MAG: family 78 glycoside hydrolase catalytic domain [Lachnospiraceae bacterium]